MDPLIKERHRKLEEIKQLEINPYPYEFDKKNSAKEIVEKNSKLKKETHTKQQVSFAERLVLLRKMGKASFAHLLDETGKIQLYIKQDTVGINQYKLWKLLDLGDIIGINGTVFATKTGEVTVYVSDTPQFKVDDEIYGSFKQEKIEVPTAAALMMLCKGVAKIVE